MIKKILSKIVFVVIALLMFFAMQILRYELNISLATQMLSTVLMGLVFYALYKYIKKNESAYYVMIYKNKMIIRDLLNQLETESPIKTEFNSATDLVINDFTNTEKLLNKGFNKYFKQKWYKPRPDVFIHPMGTQEGELSSSETLTFSELALSVGAKRAFVVTGPELSNEALLEEIKNNSEL